MKDRHKKYLKIFWIIFLSPVVFFVLLFFFISMGWLGFMPTFEDLENPDRNLATEFYSEDGIIMGTVYKTENRNNIEYQDLSPYLVQALIAREDQRYKKHSGIDGTGLVRVFGKTVLLGKTGEGGGSTITQQLAKNLFPRDTADYNLGFIKKAALAITKFKEWVIAVKLERNYSKEEIITMYLNTVSFGSEAYGIKAAARNFFSKSPDSLKVEEAAILIGMLKATTKYNPKRNPENALARRNSVLLKMYEQDYLTKAQYDSVSKIPIILKYQSLSYDMGLATYLREYLRRIMTREKPQRSDYKNMESYKFDSTSWATDPLYGWCNKNLKPDGTPYDLYSDGLKIYTTIDSRMQKSAEDAVTEHLSKTIQPKYNKSCKGQKNGPFDPKLTKKEVEDRIKNSMKQTERYRNLRNAGLSDNDIIANFKSPVDMKIFSWKGEIDTTMSPWDSIIYYKYIFRSSFMAMEPKTGKVKAYVGGPSLKYFKYDGVTQQKRQVGSTIKPFLYTLAMQNGFTPCTMAPNVPIIFELGDTVWSPKNSDKSKFDGKTISLRLGLSLSSNYISAWLLKQFSEQAVVDLINKMGIRSHIEPVPSVIYGTSEVYMYDMVSAYSIFANAGVWSQPIFVTRIEDKNGNVISTFQSQNVEVINENTAYLMYQMLKYVIASGTGYPLHNYKIDNLNRIGGKTGTTQHHADGWFMSVSPDLVTGTWVGGEEQTIHFRNLADGSGAAMALPIFGLFMQNLQKDKSILINQTDLTKPEGFNVDFDCPSVKEESEKEYKELF